MSLTGGSKFILTGGVSQYPIARSLRLRSGASAYLTRTYSAAPTTKTKCAISLWTKVAGLGAARRFMDCYDGSSGNQTWLGLNSSDQIEFTFGGASPFTRTTTAVFRDPAAHLHIHCVVDTTPATPTITVSVNGVAQTMTGTLPAQNATHQFTSANANNKVGSIYNGNGGYYEGLLSEFYFIDGIATSLPSDFGQTNATTGAWTPIKYTGTYGTNGFYLPFSQNGSLTPPYATIGSGTSTGVVSSNSFTSSAAIAIGDLVVIAVQLNSNATLPTVASISDGTANSYSLLQRGTAASNDNIELWYCVATASVSSSTPITATWSGSNSGAGAAHAIHGMKYTGVSASPADVHVTQNATTATPSLASGILAQANEIVIAFDSNQYNATPTAAPGFTALSTSLQSGNANMLSVRAVQTTASITDAPTFGGSTPTQQIVVSFKVAADSRSWISADFSGNANHWVSSGISITAGVTNDSLVDTPTNYGSDTGAGSEVRGNYATWNPLEKISGTTLQPTNGNLTLNASSGVAESKATIWSPGFDYYCEITVVTKSAGLIGIGVGNSGSAINAGGGNYTVMREDGNVYQYPGTTNLATYSAIAQGDVIGVGITATQMTIYQNGTLKGTVTHGIAAPCALMGMAYYLSGSGVQLDLNSGQRPFVYQTPSTNRPAATFKALCTQNLPNPAIVKPNLYFDAVTQAGSAVNTGANLLAQFTNFTADFAWGKDRAAVNNHQLVDTVRGNTAIINSNLAAAETTYTAPTSGDSCIAWGWKGGGAGVSNTNGTIPSTVSANPTAGFSISKFTGNGTTGATVGHGLGVAPSMLLVKNLDDAISWINYHSEVVNTSALFFTGAAASAGNYWNSTNPGLSVFTLGTSGSGANISGKRYVAYCFAEVAGFSKFGSYTGNSSNDGPFVWCGFRPRYVMVKGITTGTRPWVITDTARDTKNVCVIDLEAQSSAAEVSGSNFTGGISIDIVANGFKVRTIDGYFNTSGDTYIFAAFAESPFKTARAR